MKTVLLPCLSLVLVVELAFAADACDAPFEPASGSYQFVREQSAQPEFHDGASVGRIFYTRLRIFDEANPDENNALFRWANRFHVLTRPAIIEQQLLFQSGQDYDARLLEESARLLRTQGYFYDADIRPVRSCDDDVDVEVITKDNWSLTPSLSFDRSGGENTWAFGLRNSNVLGFGKHLSVASGRDEDQHFGELSYEDNNVRGTRLRNRTALIEGDEASLQSFRLGLPFFSLDSRRAWDVNLQNERRIEKQYFRGDDVSEVDHEISDVSFEYGFSGGLRNEMVQRLTFGYRYRHDRFEQTDELPPPAVFPDSRRLSYPWLRYERVEDNFDRAFNLDQIYRTEDLHLGYTFSNRLGYAVDALGSDREALVFDGYFRDTIFYNDGVLWQHGLEWEGLWNLDSEAVEDLMISYETRYFRRQNDYRAFFASFEAVWTRNLNTHQQVVMGGLSGARAFDNRFQTGDRSLMLTLEQRIYTDVHLWNLIHVGGAVFLDVGRAWEPGVSDGLDDEYLADIGFGLRLTSSKAASGRVAHIDIAFPLSNRNDPDVDSVQVALNIKGTF